MRKPYLHEQVKALADRYREETGEHVYSGREDGARHYFSDGLIVGDSAALEHMKRLCADKGVQA